MADSITKAILEGVAPFQRNIPKKVTIEYSPGQTIVLKGDALKVWWAEYSAYYALAMTPQEPTRVMGPAITSEALHELFEKSGNKNDKKTDDNKE